MRDIAFVSAGIGFVSADTNANLVAMHAKGTKSSRNHKAVIGVDSLTCAVSRLCQLDRVYVS